MTPHREIAPAKLNLALHVRARRDDGRHEIETLFAFCTDGDRLSAEPADDLSLDLRGPFAGDLGEPWGNLVFKAACALRDRTGTLAGARLTLTKTLPIASGIGGGSADAAAALRLLTAMWGSDPAEATAIAPALGADVPACLLSSTALGSGVGDRLQLVDDPDLAGQPVLLLNPLVPLSTAEVFGRWDGVDRGPLGDWRSGRNDLQAGAVELLPEIDGVLEWLGARPGASFVRMSGSGATCFALFASEEQRDLAAEAVPAQWWKLASRLR